MKRREFLARSGALLACGAGPRSLEALASTRKRSNLLFITADDMDASIPGFMGGRNRLTPELDRLAGASYQFVHNRTVAPICQPSREAMMTGRLPHRSGGLGFDPIHDGVPTLTKILKDHGYFTAAIHKTEHMQPPSCFPWTVEIAGSGRAPSEYADAVRASMEKARDAGQPFFINCNINDPHRPFYGSEAAAKIDHQQTGEYRVSREVEAAEVAVPPFLEDLPDVRRELAQYANSAQRMDISIGKVLKVLADSPEAENTIVFFSADHGMPFPFSKATVYDSGTRTPALLHLPGMRAPRVIEQRTCNVDYLPTLLGLLRMPVPDGVDGVSWAPLLRGKRHEGREFVVTYVNNVSSGSEYPQRAIQDERYALLFMPWADGKLRFRIESMQGLTYPAMVRAAKNDEALAARLKQLEYGVPLALYDLQTDPGQRVNLIGRDEHAERARRMKGLLLESMKRTGDPQLENFEAFLDGRQPVVTQPGKLKFSPA